MPEPAERSPERRSFFRRLEAHAPYWAAAALVALSAHLVIWWWAARHSVSSDLVVAYYGSRLIATALVFVTLMLLVLPTVPAGEITARRRTLLLVGRTLCAASFVLLVIQAILFQRNALRLFFDRFALRLF